MIKDSETMKLKHQEKNCPRLILFIEARYEKSALQNAQNQTDLNLKDYSTTQTLLENHALWPFSPSIVTMSKI